MFVGEFWGAQKRPAAEFRREKTREDERGRGVVPAGCEVMRRGQTLALAVL